MTSALPTPVLALANRPLLRHMLRPLAAFGAIVLVGVVGFWYWAHVGLVDALFWIIDPTSIELHFQAHDGDGRVVKAFAVLVRAGMVVTVFWIGETALASAFGGQIHEELQHMRMERQIADRSDHVVVCGYGTFGKTIANALAADGRDPVVIERQDAQFDRALDDGLLAVQGDARREEVLKEAGVDRATVVVAAIDDSNANIQIAITAGQLAPEVRIVVRVGDGMYEQLARRAGADEVIIPEVASAEQVTGTL
ncbi:MAG: TrkA family potassium uptake protein [Halanaeroarchaeum sp.]